jgi:hypothetical protein
VSARIVAGISAAVAFTCVLILSWTFDIWVTIVGGVAVLVTGRAALVATRGRKGFVRVLAWGAVLGGLGVFSAMRVAAKADLIASLGIWFALPVVIMAGAALGAMAVVRTPVRAVVIAGLALVALDYGLFQLAGASVALIALGWEAIGAQRKKPEPAIATALEW